MFYESMVTNAIFFTVVCWGSGPKAASVVGVELDSRTVVSERRMLSKLLAILDNTSHPLHNVLSRYRSMFSQRLFQPRCSTTRHGKSFLLVSIRLYNSSVY